MVGGRTSAIFQTLNCNACGFQEVTKVETTMMCSNRVDGLRSMGWIVAAGALMGVTGGCAAQVTPVRDPVAHAQSLMPVLCGDVTASERAAVVLAKHDALGVEPAADVRPSPDGLPRGFPKGPKAPELQGATMRFAAVRGVTAPWLQRQLECHESEVVTGRAPLTANDPYVVPNEWLEIRVKEQGSAFVVEPLARIAAWWKVAPAELLVVSDDLDLPFGRLRMRRSGGSGGHNGLKSVIEHFGEGFPRLRVGIGRGAADDAIDHVLLTFDALEEQRLGEIVEAAARGVLCWLDEGGDAAMNLVNGWQPSWTTQEPPRAS